MRVRYLLDSRLLRQLCVPGDPEAVTAFRASLEESDHRIGQSACPHQLGTPRPHPHLSARVAAVLAIVADRVSEPGPVPRAIGTNARPSAFPKPMSPAWDTVN